jgi:hypothetical protein
VRGEHLRASAILGGEEGDDVTEDAVGEAADPVLDLEAISSSPFLHSSPPLGSGDLPHGGVGAAAGSGNWGIGKGHFKQHNSVSKK